MTRRIGSLVVFACALWTWGACGGGEASGQNGEAHGDDHGEARDEAHGEGSLSAAQLERGIGPIDRLDLGPIDAALAEQGAQVFNLKCSACHKLTDRYVGPPLGEVLDRRTPEFVMNMMLNPAEMVEKHPVVRELLAQYMTPMPFQNMTRDEARAVLEHLRSIAAAKN
ncbi:MAG: cytochrome c [Gemmatimonadetes bacterium]|nr:cytochrome c [Gemmatimonadota bacterium]